jgi:tetratricopeptide (TPR) repeat protein
METEARLLAREYPHIGFVWKVLGVALKSQGKEALLPLKKAAELMPNDVESHCNLALALQEIGQLQAAVASCRRALVIRPDHVPAYNNLSSALRELRQLDAAAESARRAMVFDPSYAAAYHGLGVVLRGLGDNNGAAENCHRALQIAPQLTGAMTFMAELEADKGDFARAEELFRRAIAIEPELAEGWAGIAAVRRMTKADDDWLASALSIVGHALPPRDEARLRFAIGKFYDDVREFDSAFAHYQRANELCKLYGNEYNRPQQMLAIDAIERIYSRAWLEREQRHGDDSQRPVFIVGMPRTGTSLVEQILASHRSVFGAGELSFWKDATAQHAPSILTRKIDEGALPKLARDYLAQLQRISPHALRVIDKMPGNFLHLGLIHAAFPKARIIHMQRNPIDTCLSIYFQHFNTAHAYANDLDDIAHYYGEYARLMDHWCEVLPADAILHVPYEGLVDDQEGWSRKMLDFIDLPWDARCIDFHQCRRTVSTASNWQVRQKISKNSVQRWRNYEQFLGPLKKLVNAQQNLADVHGDESESADAQQKLAQLLRRAEQMLRGDESANEVMSIETAARRLPEAVELALTMR